MTENLSNSPLQPEDTAQGNNTQNNNAQSNNSGRSMSKKNRTRFASDGVRRRFSTTSKVPNPSVAENAAPHEPTTPAGTAPAGTAPAGTAPAGTDPASVPQPPSQGSPARNNRFGNAGVAPQPFVRQPPKKRFGMEMDGAAGGNAPSPQHPSPQHPSPQRPAVSRQTLKQSTQKKPTQATSAFRSSEPRKAFVPLPFDAPFERTRLFFVALLAIPLCIWASLLSWKSMVYEWYHTDDYSHGFLVIPATIYFLYVRMDSYPGTRYKLDWVGLFPLLLYITLRIYGGLWYIEIFEALAIWFWILSIVWFFYGWRVFLWALPSLCFLLFMFQLPWRVDVLMKNHLQLFAAQFAAILLQMMGEVAIPMKNTIRLATLELGVEAACSGLRFLVSVFAIAFAAVLLLRRPWWQNVLILAIAAPLALFVNAVRIAITGILLLHHHEMVAGWTAEGKNVAVTADDFAGKIAICLALGLFALFVWYLGKLLKRVEI